MKNVLPLIVAIVFGLSSCKKEKSFVEELRSSPDEVSIGSNTFTLSTYLYRDFMPGIVGQANGSHMICSNQLTDINNTALPSGITLKKQYIIKGGEVWEAAYTEQVGNAAVIEGIVRDGPKWDTGIIVDVVCEFETAGETYRIIARSQLIHRTE
jgi:hypothetical protein